MTYKADLLSLGMEADQISINGIFAKKSTTTANLLILDKVQFPICEVTVVDGCADVLDINGVSYRIGFWKLKPILKRDLV